MITKTQYRCSMATTPEEVIAAQSLRFQVFNMEMDEGLDHSYLTNLDRDAFDQVCEHLIVTEDQSQEVVGTYRFQTGQRAKDNLGYYSEREFDLSCFDTHRPQVLELGRACIHRDHRNLTVLNLLWKEIARFAKQHQLRYLIGCSSLTTQNQSLGLACYKQLAKSHLAAATLRTPPHPAFECHQTIQSEPPREPSLQVKIPKLLSAYLMIGAKIGGRPAIDREFKTIDFLTILDLDALPHRVWRRFLS